MEILIAIIFHITRAVDWHRQVAEGRYQPDGFPVEGFIHCSTRDQVIQVANARFSGQTGLVLLFIDTDKIDAEIIYENLEGGQQLFPHIYGKLNIDAVAQVSDFTPTDDGYFILPSGCLRD